MKPLIASEPPVAMVTLLPVIWPVTDRPDTEPPGLLSSVKPFVVVNVPIAPIVLVPVSCAANAVPLRVPTASVPGSVMVPDAFVIVAAVALTDPVIARLPLLTSDSVSAGLTTADPLMKNTDPRWPMLFEPFSVIVWPVTMRFPTVIAAPGDSVTDPPLDSSSVLMLARLNAPVTVTELTRGLPIESSFAVTLGAPPRLDPLPMLVVSGSDTMPFGTLRLPAASIVRAASLMSM